MRTRTTAAGIVAACLIAVACEQAPTALSDAAQGPDLRASATAYTETGKDLPFSWDFWVDCAVGGAGEWVHAEGTIHYLLHETLSPSGQGNYVMQSHPAGLTGTGQTTGDTYRTAGSAKETDTFGAEDLPLTVSYVQNARLIGPGPHNNYLATETYRLVINANGDVLLDSYELSPRCK